AAFAELAGPLVAHRQREGMAAGLLGEVLATLTGIPGEARQQIEDRATTFLGAVESDPASRRTAELARLVATISGAGPTEYDACVGVLNVFAGYVRAVQSPELEPETYR